VLYFVLMSAITLQEAQEILSLKPPECLQHRVHELPAKSRAGILTVEEEQDWQRYELLEHLVRMAKAKARLQLAIQEAMTISRHLREDS